MHRLVVALPVIALGGSGGDGSNVSWLDGSVYGEQVSGQAYFGGGGYSGDSILVVRQTVKVAG